MSKYDFGYEIDKNRTNEWAFENVIEKTHVLELGASNGALARHLKEDKQCKVDIVEIDAEMGRKASKYANISVVGMAGNLDDRVWYEYIKDEKYDYIIILDVLEHLRFPEITLSTAKKCLKEDGKILLSVPNLAHNAVLVQLLNDNFPYTELGLLDNTHIHFFTYKTLHEMLKNLSLRIDKWEVVEKAISDTEIPVSYTDVSEMQAYLLKKREYGIAYQYLLTVSINKTGEAEENIPPCQRDDMYKAKILINGLSKNLVEKEVSFENCSMEVDLEKYENVQSVRFVPYSGDALITGLNAKLITENISVPVNYNWTTGVEMGENSILFHRTASFEINYLLTGKYKKFRIEWNCIPILEPIGSKIADEVLRSLKEKQDKIQNEIEMTRKAYELSDRLNQERNSALEKNAWLDQQNNLLSGKIEQNRKAIKVSEERNKELSIQLDSVRAELEKNYRIIKAFKSKIAGLYEENNILDGKVNRYQQLLDEEKAKSQFLQEQFELITGSILNWAKYKLNKLPERHKKNNMER